MRHLFIINPIAGNGKQQLVIANIIKSSFENKNIDFEIYYTTHKGSIKEYVDFKCSDNIPSVIYACGGDGTLHEAINAAISHANLSIGVIPCGSGNDFIKNFNNPNNFLNIDAQIEGRNEYIDLIKIGDKYAASVCNIGLDADAAFNMHKFKKIPFITGSSRYLLSVLYCLLRKLGKNLEVILDNNIKINGTYLLGVVANGHSYGGGYKCAPLATINDGIMDLCFVNNISRLKILGLIDSYKKGTHLENDKLKNCITYKKCKHVNIKSKSPINLCIDGESFIYDEVEITVINNALKFWVPKGTQIQSIATKETA